MISTLSSGGRVHILGAGFLGQSIGDHLARNPKYYIFKYNRNDLISILNYEKKIDIQAGDKLIFSAAKAPCKNLSDLKINLDLTERFIAFVKKYPFAFLLNISSDAVYPDSNIPIKENVKASPTSWHGIMHMTRELMLQSAFPGRVGNIRPTLTYGANDPHNGYGPNRFVRNAIKLEPIEIFGAGEELRDHIYVKDLAIICELMLNLSFADNLNGVSGHVQTFDEIAHVVQEIVPETKIIYLPRVGPVPHGGYREFDTESLCNLGFNRAPTPLKHGIVEMMNQEKGIKDNGN